MQSYDSYSDDFYLNTHINTEMDLQCSRESVLHFFEQLRKKFPTMRNFYRRDTSEHVLEEDKDRGHYRWAAVDEKRVCTGHVNPSSLDEAIELHTSALEMAPYTLSVSPLDCESLNVMLGFDFTYRGNHNALLADVLGLPPALEGLAEMPGATPITFEPTMQLAMSEDCKTQVRLSFETRTSAYHVRTGEYPEEQLSVYLTAVRYGSLDTGVTFVETMQGLKQMCCDIVDDYVAEHVLVPLQQTISMK